MNTKQNLPESELRGKTAEGFGCRLCPRQCGTDRSSARGFCGETTKVKVSWAALHFGEEPCISGTNGSGAIFFSGCPMHCVFCQNYTISGGSCKLAGYAKASEVSPEKLREIYFDLIKQGAHNINLVTPTHYTDSIIKSLQGGLPVPVIWNTSGYERIETLKRLEGLVQIYLPDFKYSSSLLAEEYSHAPDYPEKAESAVLEMIRQTGGYKLDKNGLLKSGVIIRHLVLPGAGRNTRGVIDRVAMLPNDSIIFSLMSQYTPIPGIKKAHPELSRPITAAEYSNAVEYAESAGIKNLFIQQLDSAGSEYVPDFSGIY